MDPVAHVRALGAVRTHSTRRGVTSDLAAAGVVGDGVIGPPAR